MDIFTIGREIGLLTARVDRIEGKIKAWQVIGRRLLLVGLLWSVAVTGMINREEASDIAAAIIKKVVMSALTGI